jgi:NADH dehydrogenase [ubiquinone] 1 alpha subcomplex assembly factor 7
MSALLDHLRRRIAHEGPLTIAQYMETCLAHPEHGYYMTRDPFGEAGDFTTAPEISQMFGELIGLWAAQVWQSLGMPENLKWIELGPGRGTLSADAHRAMSGVPGLSECLEIHLVETSPVLRERQAATLSNCSPVWHDTLATIPTGPCVFIANEFFDALPVRQLVRAGAGWKERTVTMSATGALEFSQSPMLGIDPLLPRGLKSVTDGDVAEISPASIGIVRAMADWMRTEGGAALVVDYGHNISAPGDTLQAVKNHTYHEVLDAPGEADLTAHVDFAELASTARQAGADVHGPVAQAMFLKALGIEIRAAQLCDKASSDQQAAINSALARLTASDAMGRLFKVMAITAPGLPQLDGFEA